MNKMIYFISQIEISKSNKVGKFPFFYNYKSCAGLERNCTQIGRCNNMSTNSNLFICMTYGQIINTIQMVNSVIPKDEANDIILTDYCRNSMKIANNIATLDFFRNIYHLRIKDEYYRGNLIKKIKKSLKLFMPSKVSSKKFGIESWKYDKLFFTDFGLLTNQVFFYVKETNPKCQVYRVEEGYSTYTIFNGNVEMQKVAEWYGKITKKKTIYKSINGLYLYAPDLVQYEIEYEKIKIPVINSKNAGLIDVFNRTFGIQSPVEITNRRYIFFEESFSVDKAEADGFDDMKLIEQIIDCVGEENICIKTHPRTVSTQRYRKYTKIEIMNSSVPWELMYLNCNLRGKILLTITSGSVINALPWTKQTAKVVLLFKCIEPKPHLCTSSYEKYLELLMNKYGGKNFYIPINISSFKEYCEKRLTC